MSAVTWAPARARSRMNPVSTIGITLQEVCQFQSCEKIPPGYYLVLGDNRPLSVDSRQIGLIHENQILGHVVGAQWMDHRDN